MATTAYEGPLRLEERGGVETGLRSRPGRGFPAAADYKKKAGEAPAGFQTTFTVAVPPSDRTTWTPSMPFSVS